MNKEKTSTGDCSTGNYSTGNYSTGNYSTGNYSTGHDSTGNWSTGHRSTGNWSTGNYSTGNRSTGDWSTGDWSTGDFSTGHFSTEDYSGYGCFDKPCTPDEWCAWSEPLWLYFDLTEWVNSSDMTKKEKEANPNWETNDGYLKVYDYKEAFQKSYNEASREDQLMILNAPNFDAEKFLQISGIDVRETSVEEMTMEQICEELGRKVKIKK